MLPFDAPERLIIFLLNELSFFLCCKVKNFFEITKIKSNEFPVFLKFSTFLRLSNP